MVFIPSLKTTSELVQSYYLMVINKSQDGQIPMVQECSSEERFRTAITEY
jgi:hypothetical protein